MRKMRLCMPGLCGTGWSYILLGLLYKRMGREAICRGLTSWKYMGNSMVGKYLQHMEIEQEKA